MSTIKIDQFHGIAPKIHPTLLPDGMAVEAHNCRLKNGKLVPLRYPSLRSDIPISRENQLSSLADCKSVYLWRNGINRKTFLAFGGDVHFAESNLNDDEYNRVFVSGDTGLGDSGKEPGVWLCANGEDDFTRYPLAKDALAVPRVRRAEGQRSITSIKYCVIGIDTVENINGMTTAPDVNDVYGLSNSGFIENGPNGGGIIVSTGEQIVWKGSNWEKYDVNADQTAILRYTYFFQTWVDPYGYESGVSDQSINYSRTFHSASAPSGESTADYGWTITVTNGIVNCVKGEDQVNFPVSHALLAESSGTYTEAKRFLDEDTSYFDGDSIIIEALKSTEIPVNQSLSGYKRRIYKVITGTETESVQFIAEFADDPWGAHTVSVKDEDAGEILTRMESIPRDLTWMSFVAGGYYAGFCPSKPHTVMFSEIGYPYDWPVAYQYDVKDKIIGLAVTSNSVFALTDNFPWVLSGTAPESMTVAKIAGPAACVSSRSICVHKNAVFFASNVGIAMIYNDADAGTVCKNLTDAMFTKEQWNALNPSSCLMVQHDDALHCFFTTSDGEHKGYIIDLNGSQNAVTTHDEISPCLCVDNTDDTLYFVRETEVL